MGRKSRRALWADKIAGKLSSSSDNSWGLNSIPATHTSPYSGLVLGVDPSLRGTGLALLEFTANTPRLLTSHTVKLKPNLTFAECLGAISKAVSECLELWTIQHVALEQTIYVQNFQTAQTLGAARGAVIAAVAVKDIPVFEYPPLRIKQAVVGFGRASKEQVARTMQQYLNTNIPMTLDETDAAGAAFCHAMSYKPTNQKA